MANKHNGFIQLALQQQELVLQALAYQRIKRRKRFVHQQDVGVHGQSPSQANIYLREYFAARADGKEQYAAQGAANNALTRAALPRVDGQDVNSMSKRDREVFALEAQLKERIRSEMTAEELEQLDMLERIERREKTPQKARK